MKISSEHNLIIFSLNGSILDPKFSEASLKNVKSILLIFNLLQLSVNLFCQFSIDIIGYN